MKSLDPAARRPGSRTCKPHPNCGAPAARPTKRAILLIVLTGIDGAGKTTAARGAVEAARLAGGRALLLRNHAGRRNLTQWSARTGVPLSPRLADALETVIRTINVLVSHARAHSFPGLVVMDRHLHCQLGLRSVRGLPHGRFLPWLLRRLPKPDLAIHFDIAPEEALERILRRGTDTETLEELTALSEGYRALPEFPGFLRIDAGGAPDEVLDALTAAINGAAAGAGPGTARISAKQSKQLR